MNETWWVEESDLDDDQKEVIDLGPEGNHLIIGPPGSGKTNLLLLRANYLCSYDKPNVMILVFTRTLREFIVSGASRYSFSVEKAKTYFSWAKRFLTNNGAKLDDNADFEYSRAEILINFKKILERGAVTDSYYDAILLDEAHDYLVDELEVFRSFTKNLFAVADARQQLYRRESAGVEYLKSFCKLIPLNFHYRNGLQICRLADLIMRGKGDYQPMEPTCHYDEKARPSSVKRFKFSTLREQCKKIISELETQMQAYPGEFLGVICPKHEDLREIRTYLQKSKLASECIFQDPESGYLPFDEDKPICVSTVHGAKGLEYRAVHFVACEGLRSFSTNRNMAYTGVTRAKTSLSIYHSDALLPYFESAIRSLEPRADRPRISEAFGKR